MMRKLILACAATVALGAAAFTPSAASAHGWYGGGHGGWHGGGFYRGWGGPRFYGRPVYFGGGYGGCYVKRLVPTPWGYRYRLVNRCY
ncbi:MAG: sulfur globule protein precursor [Afipia sp.]|nr:sulfur globule protein precursor [Afipia sp.]